jgi:hypothetical protein
VSYFTLRIIIILMEIIKDLYISAHRPRLPSPPSLFRGWGMHRTPSTSSPIQYQTDLFPRRLSEHQRLIVDLLDRQEL